MSDRDNTAEYLLFEKLLLEPLEKEYRESLDERMLALLIHNRIVIKNYWHRCKVDNMFTKQQLSTEVYMDSCAFCKKEIPDDADYIEVKMTKYMTGKPTHFVKRCMQCEEELEEYLEQIPEGFGNQYDAD